MPSPAPLLLTPIARADIDKNTVLCLACASSLPPPKKSNSEFGTSNLGVFTTPCCQRPICPSCIATNPRLLRYDPCLACLKGVGVVRSSPSALGCTPRSATRSNVETVVREEDTFVLGGDEDDSDDEADPVLCNARDASLLIQGFVPPVSSQETLQEASSDTLTVSEKATLEQQEGALVETETDSLPVKYYIARSDTLQGIVLRYGLNGHELCRLNNLPPSTLKTTPHLLHTRSFLILPPSSRKAGSSINKETAEQAKEREARRGKERAEKRLQTLTKEVDWRVAKAYIALADDPEEAQEREDWDRKRKESGGVGVGAGPSNLEERAIRRYLDDEEWEERQRREGARVGTVVGIERDGNHGRRWWQ